MTLEEAQSAAKMSDVVLKKPTAKDADPLDDDDNFEEVGDLNDFSGQSRRVPSALQYIYSLFEKA